MKISNEKCGLRNFPCNVRKKSLSPVLLASPWLLLFPTCHSKTPETVEFELFHGVKQNKTNLSEDSQVTSSVNAYVDIYFELYIYVEYLK